MPPEATLKQVIDRLHRALAALEDPAELRLEKARDFEEVEEELQRLNADRGKLAQELDNSEARAERLESASREVSRRLVTAMETIRAILDR